MMDADPTPEPAPDVPLALSEAGASGTPGPHAIPCCQSSTADDTLSLHEPFVARGCKLPQLFLVLQGHAPLSRPSRHGLADVDEVAIGRGAHAVQREASDGVRRLIVRVADARMSVAHATIRRNGDVFTLHDAGSKNGSIVNGVSTPRATLADGDLIQLGSTFFTFRLTGTERGDHTPVASGSAPLGLSTLLPDLGETFAKLPRLARSSISILVLGESGTGKELVARAVHELSQRPGAFVAVNCGALPGTLVEAELFGHRKGAFSGAIEDRAGLVRMSDRGTLLLDELGDLPLRAQPALLRVLQEREVMAVGATRATGVDLRVVSATHRDLRALEQANLFRADLRARIDGHTIRIPPLRERREDIGLLFATLLQRLAGERASGISLAASAARSLLTYPWPLNIRELEQRLSATLALTDSEISCLDLEAPRRVDETRAATSGSSATGSIAPPRVLSASDRAQRDALLELLSRHRGNISAVARSLGKERSQIRRWIVRYGLHHRDV